MHEFLTGSLFPLVLTLLAYQAGLLLQKKLRTPLCNPILIAVILILAVLSAVRVETSTYQASIRSISWLMTPATVCLAIPMYEQVQILKKNLRAILAGVFCGAVSCLAVIVLFCFLADFDRTLAISLLPKSVTSAIGAPLSDLSGGNAAIATAAIVCTGILANILSLPLLRLFRLDDPIAQGVALGTSGHVVATTKANEIDPLAGAVSSLSLVAAGLLTAIFFPLAVGLL